MAAARTARADAGAPYCFLSALRRVAFFVTKEIGRSRCPKPERLLDGLAAVFAFRAALAFVSAGLLHEVADGVAEVFEAEALAAVDCADAALEVPTFFGLHLVFVV